MVQTSDFAPFSALNFCKDNAFFQYMKTNEKTLLNMVVFGRDFTGLAMRFSRDVVWYFICCDVCCDFWGSPSKTSNEVT